MFYLPVQGISMFFAWGKMVHQQRMRAVWFLNSLHFAGIQAAVQWAPSDGTDTWEL